MERRKTTEGGTIGNRQANVGRPVVNRRDDDRRGGGRKESAPRGNGIGTTTSFSYCDTGNNDADNIQNDNGTVDRVEDMNPATTTAVLNYLEKYYSFLLIIKFSEPYSKHCFCLYSYSRHIATRTAKCCMELPTPCSRVNIHIPHSVNTATSTSTSSYLVINTVVHILAINCSSFDKRSEHASRAMVGC